MSYHVVKMVTVATILEVLSHLPVMAPSYAFSRFSATQARV